MKKFIVTVFDLELFDGFYIEVQNPNVTIHPNNYLNFYLCHKDCNIKRLLGGAPNFYFENESEMKNFFTTEQLKKFVEDYKRICMR